MPRECEIEHGGHYYSYSIFSDVVRDATVLELNQVDENNRTVLEVTRWDANGTIEVRLFESLPFEVVEGALKAARSELGAG